MTVRRYVGVIGGAKCSRGTARMAEEVGRGIAKSGAVLVCGGKGGVMKAACKGARSARGLTIGILPERRRSGANEYVEIAIATGINEARNLAIVRTADVLIAVGGSYGTLSEMGFALKAGKRVIGLCTWDIPGVERADTAAAAVELALRR